MKAIQLAKSSQSFKILDDWHSRFQERLGFKFQTRRVDTSFGFTDVMITGDSENNSLDQELPIIVLHGAMAGAPFAMGEICNFPAQRRMYAINIPGQSTRAAEVRLDFRTDEYGRWFTDVMNQLGIESAIVCGISWGGSVALHVAKHAPQMVKGLVLVVAGSIVKGPILKGLWHIGIPMMRFKMFPSETNRDRALEKIFTSPDELWSPYLGDAIRHWKVDFSVPPLVRPEDFAEWGSPVYAIAADQDLSFPGKAMLARCTKLFPNLLGTHLLKNSCHSPSFRQEDRERFTEVFADAIHKISKQISQPVSHIGNH